MTEIAVTVALAEPQVPVIVTGDVITSIPLEIDCEVQAPIEVQVLPAAAAVALTVTPGDALLEVAVQPPTPALDVSVTPAGAELEVQLTPVDNTIQLSATVVGPEGSAGPVGPQGPEGPASTVPGPQGAAGPAGPTGFTGPTGPIGLPGEDSVVPGPQGPVGATGATGPTGPVGPAGADGADSVVPGPQGPTGPQGIQGPVGSNGTNGLDGAMGLTGNTGPIGSQGPVGPSGPQGPTGPSGPASVVPGPAGAQGPAGADGAVGLAGPMGPQGQDGVNGIPSFKDSASTDAPIVILLTGQSNALGAGNSPAVTFPVNANVYDWAGGAWEAGVDLNAATRATYSSVNVNTGMPRGGRGNIGWSAANRIQEATGRDVYVIAVARNSTEIAQWKSGGSVYTVLASQVPTALAAVPGAPTSVDIMCYMQGEADMVSSPPLHPDEWASDWWTFWNLGVSAGWLAPDYTQVFLSECTVTFNYLDRTGVDPDHGYVTGQDFQRTVARQGGEYFRVISNQGVPIAGDAIHYTPEGMDMLGKRAADGALAGPIPETKSSASLLMNYSGDQLVQGFGDITFKPRILADTVITEDGLMGYGTYGMFSQVMTAPLYIVKQGTATLADTRIAFNSLFGIDSLVYNVDQNTHAHVFYTGGAGSVIIRDGKVKASAAATANGELVRYDEFNGHTHPEGSIPDNPTITGNVTATGGFLTDDGLHGLTEAYGLISTLITSPAAKISFITSDDGTYGLHLKASVTTNNLESVTLRARKSASYQVGVAAVAHSSGVYGRMKYNNSTRIDATDAGVTVTGTVKASSGFITDNNLNGLTEVYGLVAVNATINGAITATGNITAYYSDERLKDVSGKLEGSLDAINSWQAVRYTAKDWTPYDSSVVEIGLLAQEVQKTHPEVVAPAPFDEEYLTIRYERLVSVLVSGMQEMTQKMEAMEKRIQELEHGAT